MNIAIDEFIISDDHNLLQIDRIYEMLSGTYWASKRSKDIILKSIKNSLCFGVYKNNIQIGFARCITDYSTAFYLCDVVIEKEYQGQGLGKKLIKSIVEHDELKELYGMLGTRDAHGLYEQFGFERTWIQIL